MARALLEMPRKRVAAVPELCILVLSMIAGGATCKFARTSQVDNKDHEKQPLPIFVPARKGLVNDYSNVLDQSATKRLESTLTRLHQRQGIEFAVVFVDTTEGQSITDYSMSVIHNWDFDPKGPSEGGKILLLIAVKDQQWRFSASKSLWEDLPDEKLVELGSLMNDPFKKKKYSDGVMRCVDALIARLGERRGFELSNS